jgi:dTDP-4-amino-4,6-dideoxygalactose transaminase
LSLHTINPDLIEDRITLKTKAILVVHLYGQLVEMEVINAIATNHNLLVIEDAAQAHGAIANSNSNSKFQTQKQVILVMLLQFLRKNLGHLEMVVP